MEALSVSTLSLRKVVSRAHPPFTPKPQLSALDLAKAAGSGTGLPECLKLSALKQGL